MKIIKNTKQLLYKYNIKPKKSLSQNFLVDEKILNKMISYASLNAEDIVLEIGAGFGFLTELISKLVKKVIAVEVDSKIARILQERLVSYDNVSILKEDIIKVKKPFFNKVVSSPPYHISSPLLFWLLRKKFKSAVLTFQEEFAKKLVSTPNSKDYCKLSVLVFYYFKVELKDKISKDGFFPQPKVDSMIVRLIPRPPPFYVKNEEILREVTHVIFTQKNKKLRKAILPFFFENGITKRKGLELADNLPFNNRRPREMSPDEIGLFVNKITRLIESL
jgi:16S rRNA (adenine1518-N6/adenine1519-N6)-dimethyltransferase